MKSVNHVGDTASLQRFAIVVFATVVVMLASATASAQSAADDIRARVKEGQRVSITDENGREFTGRIRSITADTVSVERGTVRADVPYHQIVKIDRPADTLGNSALIGFGVGAATGFLLTAADDHRARACDPDVNWFGCSNPGVREYTAGILIAGGLGTAIGVGVDALIRHDRHLYRRGERTRVTVAPVLSTGSRGAVVALSW